MEGVPREVTWTVISSTVWLLVPRYRWCSHLQSHVLNPMCFQCFWHKQIYKLLVTFLALQTASYSCQFLPFKLLPLCACFLEIISVHPPIESALLYLAEGTPTVSFHSSMASFPWVSFHFRLWVLGAGNCSFILLCKAFVNYFFCWKSVYILNNNFKYRSNYNFRHQEGSTFLTKNNWTTNIMGQLGKNERWAVTNIIDLFFLSFSLNCR